MTTDSDSNGRENQPRRGRDPNRDREGWLHLCGPLASRLASATVADKAGVDVVDDYQPHRGRGCRRYAYLPR